MGRNHKSKRSRNWDEPLTKTNAKLVKYYQMQSILKAGEDTEKFISTSQLPLPVSVRINRVVGKPQLSEQLLVNTDYGEKCEEDAPYDPESAITSMEKLAWIPEGYGVGVTHRQLKKVQRLQPLRNVIRSLDVCGHINRQEVVSMIPPLLLDINPDHAVLDMCAAPGSKTSQLTDNMYASMAKGGKSLPTGIVLANDANRSRAGLLVHQMKRVDTPSLLVTQHDGQCFPSIGSITFDRILCDVPCSGDGTLRKNPDVWACWKPMDAVSIHHLQFIIAKRAAQMLKPGGRMVYSTCSMSPLEDEAVVAELLANFPSMSVVDASHLLPGFKFQQGIDTWKVLDDDLNEFSTMDDIPSELKSKFKASMFPPAKNSAIAGQLKNCIRVMPQMQNTGGFFIALLERDSSKPTPVPAKHVWAPIEEDSAGEVRTGPIKGVEISGMKDEPHTKMDEAESKNIGDFFGLEGFPISQLYSRTGVERASSHGRFYLVSEQVATLLEEINADPRQQRKVNVVAAGMRAFERSVGKMETECPFRVVQSALHIVYPFMTKQVVVLTDAEFTLLMDARQLRLDDPVLLKKCREHKLGSIVCVLESTKNDRLPVMATALLSLSSITIMASKLSIEELQNWSKLL